jgi:hypothetical protein
MLLMLTVSTFLTVKLHQARDEADAESGWCSYAVSRATGGKLKSDQLITLCLWSCSDRRPVQKRYMWSCQVGESICQKKFARQHKSTDHGQHQHQHQELDTSWRTECISNLTNSFPAASAINCTGSYCFRCWKGTSFQLFNLK